MTVLERLPLQLWLGYWRGRQLYHRYTVAGLEHLDGRRPALIVGYHGRGVAHDLCMLTVALYDRFGYLPRTLVHRGVDAIAPLKWLSDGLGFVTRDDAALAAAVARGEHVITAPGGTAEACRSFLDRYRVCWGEHLGYLRLALKHDLLIVPVAAAGADGTFIGLNNGPALGRRLGLPHDWAWVLWLGVGPLGIWPLSPPFPVHVRQLIGEPIDPRAHGDIRPGDREGLLRLHRHVTGRVQALLDRARWERWHAAAAPPAKSRPVRRSSMPNLNEMLSPKDVAVLRSCYDREQINEALRGTFKKIYEVTSGYMDAISKVFFELPEDIARQNPDRLSAANRERCLITLLAARGGGFTLAVHVYLGLMEGYEPELKGQDPISPEEIAHMIFLAGVYAGAESLVNGLFTLTRTLLLLQRIARSGDRAQQSQTAVFDALKTEFGMTLKPAPPAGR